MIREVREVAGLGGVKAAMRCVIGRVEEFVVAAFVLVPTLKKRWNAVGFLPATLLHSMYARDMIQRRNANANVRNNIKGVILVQQAVIAPPQVRLNVFVTANVASGTGGAGPQEEVTILWIALKIVVINN